MLHRSTRRFQQLLSLGAIALLAPLGFRANATGSDATPAPLGFVVTTQGFMSAGGLTDVVASDDSHVEVQAILDGSKYVTTTLIYASSPYTSVSCLDLTVEAGADTSHATRFVVSMLDHDSGRWKRVGSFRGTGDSVNLFDDINHANKYVDGTDGSMWVLVTTTVPKSKAPNGYTARLDQVEMGVMP